MEKLEFQVVIAKTGSQAEGLIKEIIILLERQTFIQNSLDSSLHQLSKLHQKGHLYPSLVTNRTAQHIMQGWRDKRLDRCMGKGKDK